MPKSIERAEGEGEAKLEALLLCCLFARLPRPAACPVRLPIASCQLPFWGANPFKFCLMSLNCCRCTSQAALRVSPSPFLSVFFATLPPQLATCTNVPNCRKCLFECPEDAATFMASARVDCTLRRRVVARRRVDKSSAPVARLTDRQTDSPEVAAVPAQVINTHVKRGNPERGGAGGGDGSE